jgi:uncharacterized protein (TIGR00106 family)
MEIGVIPLGTKTPSVSRYVAEAVKMLKNEKGIRYVLFSMGTVVEADSVEKLLEIAGKMHRVVFSEEVKRVVTTIKIDERKDKNLTMEEKIESVKQKMTGG